MTDCGNAFFSSVGWGKVKHPGGSYHKLQQAQLPLVSNAECSAKLAASPVAGRLNITQQMVCAGDLDPSDMQGGCHGDSVARTRHPGSLSWRGLSVGDLRIATLFNRIGSTLFSHVSEFRDWIDLQIATN